VSAKIATDSQQVYLDRQVGTIADRLSLYLRALRRIDKAWRDEPTGSLRNETAHIVPDAVLFPIWNGIISARQGKGNKQEIERSLDSAIRSLSLVLEGKSIERAPEDVLGKFATLVDRYVSLLERRKAS